MPFSRSEIVTAQGIISDALSERKDARAMIVRSGAFDLAVDAYLEDDSGCAEVDRIWGAIDFAYEVRCETF